MRILFMFTRLGPSGAPKMMAWIANQMAAKGHDVHMITYFAGEQTRALNENVHAYSLGIERSKSRLVRNTTDMFKIIRLLHKKVKQIQPDVVVSFLDSVAEVYLPLGRLLTKAKYVVSERVDPYSYRGKMAKVRFALMGCAHGTVFQTEGAQKFFEKYSKIYPGSAVIPNPVVLNDSIRDMRERIPSFEEREPRIVTVGRLSLNQKRQDVLLEAFKLFHEKYPDYKLEMYGDGQDKGKIQKLIDTHGLSDSVILAGRTEKVEEMIFNAKAFVLTSDYEGIPNALIEAMSIGVPSVSTDCSPGGAALLIHEGENGFIVPRGNAHAIAEKLSVVVSDREISTRFSQNSPQITEMLAESTISNKWEQYFTEIVEKRR